MLHRMKTHAPQKPTVLLTLTLLAAVMVFITPAIQAVDDKPTPLFNGKNLDGWKLRNEQHKDTWKVVSKVELDKADPKKLVGTGTGGTADAVLFRQPVEHGSDIMTTKEFGDCELHIELMVAKESNSGIYLMGRYECQVFDSFGKPDNKLDHSDMCGIYSVKAPSTNASKAPGEWQTVDIVFQAPRFDAAGKKTQNAKFVSITLNGKKVIENVEIPTDRAGTGGEISEKEAPTGPLMLQGDHGVVAYRNITDKTK